MLFEPKTYRNSLPKDRFIGFELKVAELNLWIALDPDSFREEIKSTAERELSQLIAQLAVYMSEDGFFKKTLKAYEVPETAPEVIRKMASGAALGGIGPMAALNAASVQQVAEALLKDFEIKEMFIECAGEMYLKLQSSLVLSIFAGDSDISGMVGLEIQPEQTPLAVATGIGTRGKPINYTQADAVLIFAKDACQAAGFAVGLGNKVKTVDDVDKALKRTEVFPEILGAVIIMGDQIGIRGEFELQMLS